MRSLLRLSVLDLTTPQPLHLTIRKSSLLRLLRDLLSLLSLLLNISNRHADNSSLHLERLLATTLALLSSLPSSSLLFKPYLRFLVVTSPSSRPANASGSLLLSGTSCSGNARASDYTHTNNSHLSILANVHTSMSGVNLVLRERASQSPRGW